MSAKMGSGGFPSKWTPWSAAITAFALAAFICTMAFIVLDADRQLVLDKKFESHKLEIADYELKIAECNEQLGNYEKALQKKDPTVVPTLLRLRPQLDIAIATEISKAVIKYATQFQLPPEFIVHLMKRESGFNTLAVSKAGAVGLMQVMPKAHKDKMAKLGISYSQLFHIDNNVKLGCMILRDYYNSSGSIEKALKKYVGGHHASYTQDILIGYTNETIPLKVQEPKQ